MKKKSNTKSQKVRRGDGLGSFRKQVDDLFSGTNATAFAKSLDSTLSIKIKNLESEVKKRLAKASVSNNLDWKVDNFTLKKVITLQEGHVVSIAGDSDALGADEDVKVVTTTTTITTVDKIQIETQVLVFEKWSRP